MPFTRYEPNRVGEHHDDFTAERLSRVSARRARRASCARRAFARADAPHRRRPARSSCTIAPVGDHIVRISLVPLEAGKPAGDPFDRVAGGRNHRRAPVLRVTDLAEPQIGLLRRVARQRLARPARRSGSSEPMGAWCKTCKSTSATGGFSFRLGDGPDPRPGRRRPAVRSPRLGRPHAQRPGRIPPAHPRRPRARALADRHGRLGDVRPSAQRHVRPERRPKDGSRRPRRRPLCRSTSSS